MWEGQTVYVLGGGPSARPHVDKLRGQHLIVVNASWTVAPFAEVLFFADSRFWGQYGAEIKASFPGLVVSCSGGVSDPGVKSVRRDKPPKILPDQLGVTMARTSLTGAIVLAAKAGAAKVVLVGADGQLGPDGTRHNHEVKYPWSFMTSSYVKQQAELASVAGPLRRMGVTVVNASPGSAFNMFPAVDLDNELNNNPTPTRMPTMRTFERSGEALARFMAGLPAGATVLDVGSGQCEYAAAMREAGLNVTTIDIAHPADIRANFMAAGVLEGPLHHQWFDGVWVSHVLEHQLNVNAFLAKVRSITKPDGLVAITVPPLKHKIVGGHVSLWNAGLLLYNMIVAGWDCSKARVGTYGYNISVLANRTDAVLPQLHYDCGDIELLAPFFPFKAKQGFDGQLPNTNW